MVTSFREKQTRPRVLHRQTSTTLAKSAACTAILAHDALRAVSTVSAKSLKASLRRSGRGLSRGRRCWPRRRRCSRARRRPRRRRWRRRWRYEFGGRRKDFGGRGRGRRRPLGVTIGELGLAEAGADSLQQREGEKVPPHRFCSSRE